ncbi:Psp-related protein [Tritrichomonas foetus]|uniref:Psp-related protein n=1 Tax=Tritrichomonas foetus TaxID=1144522 RepID=A0A1J4KLL2_9EUKA|nr:Psp-related protein [Tritrichomonas foetus]|eukprot:OHT10582.1 Psp-related protein [Tritrichomonas foetus]
MKNRVPFKKPPPSQYKKPEFYWRGGNTYREQEFITDEYKKALMEYRIAEQELRQVETEVAQASTTLNEREGYTTALAGFLDGDTDGFTEEVSLKQQLFQLESEIRHDEDELEKIQAVHNPAVASGLQKEKAYYLIEIQRGTKSICLAEEESTRAKEQLAACTVNSRYRQALQLEYQLDKLQRKKKFLRSLVTRTKNEFDNTKPAQTLATNEARTERSMYQEGIELKMALGRAEEKQQRRMQKHANYLNFLIDQIEELNVRMSEIGLEDQIVETEPLRDKYFGDKNEEEDEDEERKPENEDKPESPKNEE